MTVQELVNLLTSDGIDPDWHVVIEYWQSPIWLRVDIAKVDMHTNDEVALIME